MLSYAVTVAAALSLALTSASVAGLTGSQYTVSTSVTGSVSINPTGAGTYTAPAGPSFCIGPNADNCTSSGLSGSVSFTDNQLSFFFTGSSNPASGTFVVNLTNFSVPILGVTYVSGGLNSGSFALTSSNSSSMVFTGTTNGNGFNFNGIGGVNIIFNVATPAPPVISESFNPSTIGVNGTTALSFAISNTSSTPGSISALSGIGFTDPLPAGLTVATPNGLTGSCGLGSVTAVAGSGTISLSGATLGAGDLCRFSVNVTASAAGPFNNVTSAVTSNTGPGNTASATLTVIPPLRIVSPSSLSAATEGVPYSPVTFTASGGTGGYTWSAAGLPSALTLSSAGVLTGTPATGTRGTYSVAVTVTDSSGASAPASPALTVLPPPALTLTAVPNPSAFGQAVTLTATVSPPTATGPVTFYDSTTILGLATLQGGRATLTTTLLPSGSNSLRAFCGCSVGPVASAPLGQTVSVLPQQGFATAVDYSVGPGPRAAAIGDFNGDGFQDLVVANAGVSGTASLSVLLGNGDGTFQAASSYNAGPNPVSVAIGDFNGDGKPDLVVANSSDTLSVLLGNGDGTFQARLQYVVGPVASFVVVGDFNGDGKADLATANSDNGSVSIALGNGDGTFQPAVTYTFESSFVQHIPFLAIADLNGDGRADLVATNVTANSLMVLLGNGDGTFQGPSTVSVGFVQQTQPAVGDFNGDGKADLAIANTDGGNVSVLLGNGDGTFLPPVSYSAPSPLATGTGDFNGDGKADLVVTNSAAGSVSVLLGNGDGTFQTPVSYNVNAANSKSVVVGSFRGDGLSDLAVANDSGSNVGVLHGLRAQAITFGPLGGVSFGAAPFTIGASATSLLPVSFASTTPSVCPVSGNTVTILSAGTCSVTASQAGNAVYAAAASVIQSFIVAQLAQTIAFGAPGNHLFGDAPFTIGATASSGLAVGFTSTTPSVCTASGNTVTLVAAGTCSILASQPGNVNYLAAPNVSQSFVVGRATTVITWSPPAPIAYGTPLSSVQLNATAGVPGTFVYTPAAGTVLPAGTGQTLSVTFRPNDAGFTGGSATTTITVLRATPAISWSAQAIVYGTPLSAAQLNASANVPGTFVYSPAAGTILSIGNAQPLSVTFTPTDIGNFLIVTGSTTINVGQARPIVTWSAPGSITFGTALSATQLNATANVPGTFIYTPPAGAILSGGNGQTLSVTFTPANATVYTSAIAVTTINVSQAAPTVTWSPPVSITYGTALSAAQLNATANVPGTFVYSPPAGTILSAGNAQTFSVTFTPSSGGDYAIVTTTATISVAQAHPTVIWSTPAPITVGTPLSAAQLNATANVPGTFAYTPAAGIILPAGDGQALSVVFTPADATDYTTASAGTRLNVSQNVSLTCTPTTGPANVSVDYSAVCTVIGGIPPYIWSISGALPAGLTSNSSNPATPASLTISGAPASAAVGVYSYSVNVVDSAPAPQTVSQAYSGTILPPLLTLNCSLTTGPVLLGTPYLDNCTAGGGVAPYHWSISSSLPPGLTLSASTGLTVSIGGAPTVPGSYTYSLQVMDTGASVAQSVQIVTLSYTASISGPVITTASLSQGTVGTSYAFTLGAQGGTSPLTWSVGSGNTAQQVLPPGLSLNAATGAITGTPTTAGSFSVPVQVSDARQASSAAVLGLVVSLPGGPSVIFNPLTTTANPVQQLSWPVSLGSSYPLPVSGRVVLSFTPAPGLVDDPAIQFSTGGRTAAFSVDAGSLQAAATLAFQTGTVAGTITLTVNLSAGGQDITPTPAPGFSIQIAALPPVITAVTMTRVAGGFNAQITGYATSRQVTAANFQFNAIPGGTLQTTQLTPQVGPQFATWYGSADSIMFGSQFTFIQPFQVQGDAASITSVTISLENAQGKSAAVTAKF
jgi:hypothetical protein